MRAAALLLTGVIIGMSIQSVLAQQGRIVALNHVAISVADYAAATRFYAKQMGFREAFSFREANGDPYFTYFQISRDTFLEVMQATPARPSGCPHFGLEVQNLDAVVDELRQRGVDVRPPSLSPRTGTRIAQAVGPGGINMELLEMGPASLHRKAIDAWK
jgi:catechol 2,3-dioxygenase-like lactoylglutathione lyase family enzyme